MRYLFIGKCFSLVILNKIIVGVKNLVLGKVEYMYGVLNFLSEIVGK